MEICSVYSRSDAIFAAGRCCPNKTAKGYAGKNNQEDCDGAERIRDPFSTKEGRECQEKAGEGDVVAAYAPIHTKSVKHGLQYIALGKIGGKVKVVRQKQYPCHNHEP